MGDRARRGLIGMGNRNYSWGQGRINRVHVVLCMLFVVRDEVTMLVKGGEEL